MKATNHKLSSDNFSLSNKLSPTKLIPWERILNSHWCSCSLIGHGLIRRRHQIVKKSNAVHHFIGFHPQPQTNDCQAMNQGGSKSHSVFSSSISTPKQSRIAFDNRMTLGLTDLRDLLGAFFFLSFNLAKYLKKKQQKWLYFS